MDRKELIYTQAAFVVLKKICINGRLLHCILKIAHLFSRSYFWKNKILFGCFIPWLLLYCGLLLLWFTFIWFSSMALFNFSMSFEKLSASAPSRIQLGLVGHVEIWVHVIDLMDIYLNSYTSNYLTWKA